MTTYLPARHSALRAAMVFLVGFLSASCARIDRLAVSNRFSETDMEEVLAAIDAWRGDIPGVAGLDVTFTEHSRSNIRPTEKGHCRKKDRLGYTELVPFARPVVHVCPRAFKERLVYKVTLHELGHALALKAGHLPDGNVMAKGSGQAADSPTAADVEYVGW
jgi:hypothetical protein